MKIHAIKTVALGLFCLVAGCAPIISSLKPASTPRGITSTSQAKHIAFLLPLNGSLGHAGQAVRDGALAAYYKAKQSQSVVPKVNFYNTASNQNVVALYNQALAQGADMVIGPLDKPNIAKLTNSGSIKVPTLVLNDIPERARITPDLLQLSLTQAAEAEQVAKQAWQDGKRRALLIIPPGRWGAQIGQAFASTWQQQGGVIVDSMSLQRDQNVNLAVKQLLKVGYLQEELKHPQRGKKTQLIPRPRQDADMIFIALSSDLARQIKPLLQFYYADNLTVYATSLAIGSQATPNEALDMQGVIICDMPWVISQPQPHAHADQKNRLYALGMDSYELSQNLYKLNSSAGFSGNIGVLQLGANNKINRRLVCTTLTQTADSATSQAILNTPNSTAKGLVEYSNIDANDEYVAF